MEQTIIQIGNSAGVVIPSEVRKQMGLKKGSRVIVELGADKRSLIVVKAGRARGVSTITPEFIKILEGVNKRYGPALSKLAKL